MSRRDDERLLRRQWKQHVTAEISDATQTISCLNSMSDISPKLHQALAASLVALNRAHKVALRDVRRLDAGGDLD